jgi:hypothetical protein
MNSFHTPWDHVVLITMWNTTVNITTELVGLLGQIYKRPEEPH